MFTWMKPGGDICALKAKTPGKQDFSRLPGAKKYWQTNWSFDSIHLPVPWWYLIKSGSLQQISGYGQVLMVLCQIRHSATITHIFSFIIPYLYWMLFTFAAYQLWCASWLLWKWLLPCIWGTGSLPVFLRLIWINDIRRPDMKHNISTDSSSARCSRIFCGQAGIISPACTSSSNTIVSDQLSLSEGQCLLLLISRSISLTRIH